MKVILLENVQKVGSIGDVIDVKRGFARNYLISKKKALFASSNNIKELYGSVKPTEISKILEKFESVKINPSLIQPSKEIKSIGNFAVYINLHPEVETQIVIKTISQEEKK
jgi:large subunit ribosomal protein L9